MIGCGVPEPRAVGESTEGNPSVHRSARPLHPRCLVRRRGKGDRRSSPGLKLGASPERYHRNKCTSHPPPSTGQKPTNRLMGLQKGLREPDWRKCGSLRRGSVVSCIFLRCSWGSPAKIALLVTSLLKCLLRERGDFRGKSLGQPPAMLI